MPDKRNLIRLAALIALSGFILSGPVGFSIVQLTKPQPDWISAEAFAAAYHPLQDIPYYFGFILVGGMLWLAASLYLNTAAESSLVKLHLLLALAGTTIFATLILFNYICQTTFIPHLATRYSPANSNAISLLSMANPASLSWAIEMWGYAILGVATWLMASFYREKNKTIYSLLIVNGFVSLLSVVLFTINGQWLLTTTGLAGYLAWNLLMIVLLFLIYKHAKRWQHENH